MRHASLDGEKLEGRILYISISTIRCEAFDLWQCYVAYVQISPKPLPYSGSAEKSFYQLFVTLMF